MRFVPILFSALLFGVPLQARAQDCKVCPMSKPGLPAERHATCLTDPEMAVHIATRKPIAPPGLNEPHMSLHGTVVACLCFSPTGKVTRIDIHSGPAMLQPSVLESLRDWTFSAVGKGGRLYGGCGRLRVHVDVDGGIASSNLEAGNP